MIELTELACERDTRRVKFASLNFWKRYKVILMLHGISRADVQQQAWVEMLDLTKKNKLTLSEHIEMRLLDWMRHLTHFQKKGKTMTPALVLVEELPDEPTYIDFERYDQLRRVRDELKHRSDQMRFIMDKYVEGYSMKAIGQMIDRTEGRVCQRINSFIKDMNVEYTKNVYEVGPDFSPG